VIISVHLSAPGCTSSLKRAMLALGMQTLFRRCVFLALLAVAACGDSRPTSYIETLQAKAEQGDAHAQLSLGFMYDKGKGVPQDYAEAHKWVNLAASRSQGEDLENFAKMRVALAERMTPSQIA
jgi:TPR repeat protein